MTAETTSQNRSTDTLVKLIDSSMVFDDPAEDLRGRKVIDAAGEGIGSVSGLFVDQDEQKVRFLEISAGGFLGMGKQHFLVPVDAVVRVEGDTVQINKDRAHVAESPHYAPELHKASSQDFLEQIYGHYGALPFWSAGYLSPGYARF